MNLLGWRGGRVMGVGVRNIRGQRWVVTKLLEDLGFKTKEFGVIDVKLESRGRKSFGVDGEEEGVMVGAWKNSLTTSEGRGAKRFSSWVGKDKVDGGGYNGGIRVRTEGVGKKFTTRGAFSARAFKGWEFKVFIWATGKK